MRLILSILMAFFFVSSAHAQTTTTVDPAKRTLILKFMDVFGTRKALTENLDMIVKQMPAANAQEAQQLRERVKVDAILNQLVPVYDQNFTTEQLQAFINFYDSPDGHILIQKIPDVMRASIDIASKYMEEKFPEMKQQQ